MKVSNDKELKYFFLTVHKEWYVKRVILYFYFGTFFN